VNWIALIDDLIMGTQGSPAPSDEFAGLTPEAALLKRLALAGTARRAGFVAAAVKKIPDSDPAPPEMLRPCSRIAVEWLKHAVHMEKSCRTFAPIWFMTIAAKRKRVPHNTLPYILGLAARHDDLAPYIVPVLGERGRWIVERSESYASLKQAELWEREQTPLAVPEIPKYPHWIEFHEQMMEGLAHE
jgi:hypothetical protein